MAGSRKFKQYLLDTLKFKECDVNDPKGADSSCKEMMLEGCFREYEEDDANTFYICRNGPLRNNTFGCFRHDHCHEKDYCHMTFSGFTEENRGIQSLKFSELGICVPVRNEGDPCPNSYCPYPLECHKVHKRCYNSNGTISHQPDPNKYYVVKGIQYRFLNVGEECKKKEHPFCAIHLFCSDNGPKCVKKCQTSLDCDTRQYCATIGPGLGICASIESTDRSRQVASLGNTFIMFPWLVCMFIVLFVLLSNFLVLFLFRKVSFYKKI